MYHKIVIPLDASTMAEKVLPYVCQIAKPGEAHLVLVHVIDLQYYAYATLSDEPGILDQLLGAAKEQASDYLNRWQNQLRGEGYSVSIRLAQGDAAQCVIDAANEKGADLIAMTTHGRSGFLRWALGSVADRVVRTAHQPVLLVRSKLDGGSGEQVQRILVPLDGSRVAEQALDQAMMVAKTSSAAISLVRAVEPLSTWERQLLQGFEKTARNLTVERIDEARAYLNRICQQLEAEGVQVTTHLYQGQAAASILNAAEKEAVDLIVMSTHGYGGYTRWAHGSVVNQVLYSATCPLLIKRGSQIATMPSMEIPEKTAVYA